MLDFGFSIANSAADPPLLVRLSLRERIELRVNSRQQEFRAASLDKRRNCRANVHLRNVRPSPPPVRRDDAHPPRLGVPAGADRHPEALKEFLPTSTPGSNSSRRDAPASGRSDRVKSRPATNRRSRCLLYQRESVA